MKKYYIGLMSGTSLDAIDAVIVERTSEGFQQISGIAPALAPYLREQLLKICNDKHVDLQTLGEVDHQFALACADVVNKLLKQAQLSAKDIIAIGSHGQTIFHDPLGKFPFTQQIGDANLIAATTGLACVADFRRMDMAYGGQGAPIVPAFHKALFFDDNQTRVILNIGGIANISILKNDQDVLGYDTGPGNMLMDAWIGKTQNKTYDENGHFAAQGVILPSLLNKLLADPYFSLSTPKSTGREKFNLQWLTPQLKGDEREQDIQRTLLEFTAVTIANQITLHSHSCGVYVCGGGALNTMLMARMQALMPTHNVTTTNDLNIDPLFLEAVAFAWLAEQRVLEIPIQLKQITGATKNTISGAIYLP